MRDAGQCTTLVNARHAAAQGGGAGSYRDNDVGQLQLQGVQGALQLDGQDLGAVHSHYIVVALLDAHMLRLGRGAVGRCSHTVLVNTGG